MNRSVETCDLCGLPVRAGVVSLEREGATYRFCCNGCRQVFIMLMESTDAGNPEQFKQTELYRKCLAMGIIPQSEADLSHRSEAPPDKVSPLKEGNGTTSDNQTLKVRMDVEGMWCSACAWVIEEGLKSSPGVAGVSCNFTTDTVYCRYDPVKTSPEKIMELIRHLGYRPAPSEEGRGTSIRKKEFIRFALSAFLAVNVMMLSFALYSGFVTQLSPAAVRKISWPLFVMASVVFFYGGLPIHRKAWIGVRMGAAGMETLITLGATGAYLLSIYNMIAGSLHLYFDTVAMLITLVLLGKAVEKRARDIVGSDLGTIFKLLPGKVRMITPRYPNGRFVKLDQLSKGDAFRVDADEIVPADGVITDGNGTVEESFMTGETQPVDRKPGDRLKCGTKVVNGAFRIEAEAVGEDSLLGQMIAIMETTLNRKTVVEGKTDRFLRGFVPVVVLLAVVTGLTCLATGLPMEAAMIRAVTVLVISCPCALGIAIPLARVAGIALSGREGILVREFSAFETAGRVNAFVFDKTGTITDGRWQLLEIKSIDPASSRTALSIAAGLEKGSPHFIASQILLEARNRKIVPVRVVDIERYENGISGRWEGKRIKIGASAFLSKELSEAGTTPQPDFTKNETVHSQVYLSVEGHLHSIFIFGDRLKTGAHATIDALRKRGHRMALISGDGSGVTQDVGDKIGFPEAIGGCLPQDKVDFVKKRRAEGHTVAMIGDGVNDAPALVCADLGVAVHSGYHLGKEVADISLMRGNPAQIPDYLLLAEKVNRKIFQNLMISLVYNVTAIPVAMAGFLNPLMAVSAMILSSLSVTGNTLLLLKRK